MTTPEIIKPTVGRKVWFRNNGSMQKLPRADGGTAHPVFCGIEQPMDATVIFVHGARMVNLDITDHIGQRFVATSVPLLQDDDAIPDMGFYCEWMPYQKGQAAKVEAKEAAAVLNNPHTGTPRDPRDVASDPQAILCVKPGEPLKAAPITLPVVDPGPDSLEREIQAKAANGPRVTPQALMDEIISAYYFTADEGVYGHESLNSESVSTPEPQGPLGLLTFCVLVLRNGFTVHGVSACASPENFNWEIGKRIARENAERAIWPLLGFRLRDELARPVLTEADAAADLAGTPRPS